jgi:hypothetical protein
MSMHYETREPEKSVTDAKGVLFAATPVWERGRKRRGLGGRKVAADRAASAPAEERSFSPASAPAASNPSISTHEPSPSPDRPVESTTQAHDGLVAPIGRRTSPSRGTTRDTRPSGAITATIAAGVVAVGALGAGAWYLMSEGDSVPELAPGSVTTEVAAAPILPPAADQATPLAVEPPLAPAATPPAETPLTTARRDAAPAPRARPAAVAPSAESAAQNASASVTLPEGPQPYASLNPGSAPAPAAVNPPVVNIPPASEAAPAPAEAPAEFPAAPPAASESAPSMDPVTPDTTPPTSS